MTASGGTTLTVGDSWQTPQGDAPVEAFLCVLLECSRLSAPASRHRLSNTEEVALGRGSDRGASRDGTTLSIQIPDKWMSSKHARIIRSFGRWVVEDAGSKNGTAVNGKSLSRSVLKDGDLIATGHSLLLYREASAEGELADDLELCADQEPMGFQTLNPTFGSVLDSARRIASSDVRVLLLGESGTGKEVLARALHELSGRAGQFVAVNCGALPANLVESELFGHKKGAFSEADADRQGLVRAADKGTLFLDEIGDLPGSSQAALLRVLQEGEVTPIGATKPSPVDIRLIAATHRDIDAMVKRGQFRHDLYARVAGFRLLLPALRERREDIGMLASLFLRRRSERDDYPGIEVVAAEKLVTYPWPLNIRELESSLSTAYVLAGRGPVELSHLPAAVQTGAARVEDIQEGASVSGSTASLSPDDQALRAQVIDRLRKHQGNISAVARDMGKDRKQIQRWVKRFQIDATQFKG